MRCKSLLQVLLMLLVGANLTLVCQGHVHGDHFEGPHLALLPETDKSGSGQSNAKDETEMGKNASLFSIQPGRSTASAQSALEGASTSILPAMLPPTVQEHSLNTVISGSELVLLPTSLATGPDTPPPRRTPI